MLKPTYFENFLSILLIKTENEDGNHGCSNFVILLSETPTTDAKLTLFWDWIIGRGKKFILPHLIRQQLRDKEKLFLSLSSKAGIKIASRPNF